MKNKLIANSQVKDILEFIKESKEFCERLHDVWARCEALKKPNEIHIETLKDHVLIEHIKNIENIYQDVYAFTSEAAYKLEAILDDTVEFMGYKLSADGELKLIDITC